MEKQKLNKKLAEWAGFRYLPVVGYEGSVWVHPDWKYGNGKWDRELPDFTQSLDACFGWLVLEAKRRVNEQQFVQMMHDWLCAFLDGQDPAPALCLAISKLIEKDIDK